MYFSIFYVFFKYLPQKKKETPINSSVHSQHTSPLKLYFPERIDPLLPKKSNSKKFLLHFSAIVVC